VILQKRKKLGSILSKIAKCTESSIEEYKKEVEEYKISE
jgi:hypothetical protein